MTSYIEMSLEDIIKIKKKEKSTKPRTKPEKYHKQLPKQKLQVTDARNKIISKKRTQITDAREKLAQIAKQKDARLKLQQLQMKKVMVQPEGKNFLQNRKKLVRTISNKERVFSDPSRYVISQPLTNMRNPRRHNNGRRHIENTSIPLNEVRSIDKMKPLKPIYRTVENDVEIIDDPMSDEEQVPKTNFFKHRSNLQLKIIARHNDSRDIRTGAIQRTAIEKEKSPQRPTSILKKRPMAALRNEKTPEKSEKPALEYRIIVSNLRNTVTGGDIEELFGDVGSMVESRLVRPGTAEVIYRTMEDAQRAVDLYHNRQLDGQPMNCLLVTPRTNAPSTKGSTKPALYSTNSNVEPDLSTFHKVLFSNF